MLCQYYREPPAWATITVFLIVELEEVLAMLMTGLLSSFTSEYCTAFLVVDRIRVTPSSHPKQMKPDAARYSVEMTLLSIFISKSLMK